MDELGMDREQLSALPYTATTVSIIARMLFMFLLYKNKSTNSLSLAFCILNIFSSGMWISYSWYVNDVPMIVRSSTELGLLTASSVYIVKNKVTNKSNQVLPS